MQSEPCENVVSTEVSGQRLVAIARGEAIGLFQVNETGDWNPLTRLVRSEASEPLLARQDHALVAGWRGEHQLTELNHRGIMQIPTGGPVDAVINGPGGWMWSLTEPSALVPLSGTPIVPPKAIEKLTSVELDALAGADVLAQTAEGVYAYFGTGGPAKLDISPSAVTPTAGDVDADGCPELFTAVDREVSVFYGACGTSVNPAVTPTNPAKPSAPITHQFKLGHDVDFHAHVGQTLRVQLAHPDVDVVRFAGRGGPLWLKVSPNGILSYKPTLHDVGMWELTILAWEPFGTVQRYPMVLRIHRDEAEPDKQGTSQRMRRRSRTYSNIRLLNNRVAFGFGASLGLSEARNSWALLGTDWVVTGSPHISIQLDNPEESGVWWSLAIESAPWFRYLTENMVMNHYLSTLSTLGWNFGETVQAGVFGQAGFFITAVGVRARWFPVHHEKSDTHHGLEFRLSWLPSNSGLAGYGAVFYVLRLPKGL